MNLLCLAIAALTTIGSIKEACEKQEIGRTFCLRASIAIPCHAHSNASVVQDATGSIVLYSDYFYHASDLKAGDIVESRGRIIRQPSGKGIPFADDLKLSGHGPAPVPTDATIAEVRKGAHRGSFVRLKGIVFDALQDDVDDQFSFFIIREGQDFIYAYLDVPFSAEQLASYVGSEIIATGVISDAYPRQHLGPALSMSGRESLSVIRAGAEDPHAAEDLNRLDSRNLVGNTIALHRRQAEGRVLAVWQEKNLLLKTDDQRLVRVELAKGKAPSCGERIAAIGLPETDLFSLNLVRAQWQSVGDANPAEQEEKIVIGRNLFRSDKGRKRYDTTNYGHLTEVTGVVKSVPSSNSGETTFLLDCDGHDLAVDIGNHPEVLNQLQSGAMVSVRGILILDTLPWHPQTPFPHIRGLLLAMRTPADLTVLAAAPWWTPAKLLAVIAILFATLIGILIWNWSLRILAERRGRELLNAQIDTLASQLKTDERTRLAVELHDSLAQNLTGVSMEIEAALRSEASGTETVKHHLTIADKALKSCRSDLRNSLWDLRNQALEESDLESAIRKTLLPHVKGVDLVISFPVPRDRFSDQSAHELLRIIRELTLNGIRHGGATRIQINGQLQGDRLAFTVTDNGSGFDPEECPGVTEGHFGLQGIRERLRTLHGQLEFVRNPNGGMTAKVETNA